MSRLLVVVLAHVLDELGNVEVYPLMAQIAERQPASRRSEWLHPRCAVWFTSFLPQKFPKDKKPGSTFADPG